MNLTNLFMLTLAVTMTARADFSYTMTTEPSGSMPVNVPPTKTYLKGQKLMVESGTTARVMDFDAQTITTINRSTKTYTVQSFADAAQQTAGADVQIDVKETGQHKNVNGFDASEVVMTMQVDTPQTQKAAMKMLVEMHLWISKDVPGSGELRAFYQRNMSRFPWTAMGQGNPSMQQSMAAMQKKMAEMNGMSVSVTVKMKPQGGAGAPTMSPDQQAKMEQARARLEAMQQQGGPQAAAAAQALARMGGAAGGGGGIETTMDAGNFSTSPIPDSAFTVPADYTKSAK